MSAHMKERLLEKYGTSESIPWEELAKERIAKYKKSGNEPIYLARAAHSAALQGASRKEVTEKFLCAEHPGVRCSAPPLRKP